MDARAVTGCFDIEVAAGDEVALSVISDVDVIIVVGDVDA